MFRYPVYLLFFLSLFIVSCENGIQGDFNENQTPSTQLTLNEINLPEGKWLESEVEISWWGDDPDGYIIGYEYYIGNNPPEDDESGWLFTTRTDSTFVLPIPKNSTNAEVKFTVRAIDNDEARDIDPPSLVFPIENSRPLVEFKVQEAPPDTTYRIASFGFTASDPDGNTNLNRLEIALNDTSSEESWKELSLNVNFITLKIDDSQENAVAEVLLGKTATPSGIQFESVNVDGENELFVRAIDNAAEISIVAGNKWYVKKQTSRVLFLNDFSGTNTNSRAAFHLELLAGNGISNVDYIDISDGDVVGSTRVQLSSAFPNRSLASPTINMMLAEWDYIYWISNDLDRNIGYALELTQQFFDRGGKMFVNIPIELLGDRHPLFQFLPFEGIGTPPPMSGRSPQLFADVCTEVTSVSNSFNFDGELRLNRSILPANAIIPFSEAIALFDANFQLILRNPTEFRDYDGTQTIAAMNSNNSLIYFGYDLTFFTTEDGTCEDPETEEPLPASDLEGLINFLTIETLGFEQ
ncbi:MAG: hypothetical protein WD361_07495 [Gracilimonas sp.]